MDELACLGKVNLLILAEKPESDIHTAVLKHGCVKDDGLWRAQLIMLSIPSTHGRFRSYFQLAQNTCARHLRFGHGLWWNRSGRACEQGFGQRES